MEINRSNHRRCSIKKLRNFRNILLVGRFLNPLLCKGSYCLPPPFSNFCPFAHFVALFLWLNGWSRWIWCVIFYLITSIDTFSGLVPLYHKEYGVCFMTQGVSLLRSTTWRGFLLILWFDITHANSNKQHIQVSIDWHTHINIY